MQFRRKSVRLLDVAPGSVVRIYFIGMNSESREETRTMQLMKKLEACREVEYVGAGGTTMKHILRPLTYPPLEGRYFLRMNQVASKEEFLVFTAQAATILFGVKPTEGRTEILPRLMSPSSSAKPLRFLITKDKVQEHPGVTIVTEDRQRGIRLVCRQKNIMALIKLCFVLESKGPMNSRVDDETEIIAIETNTIDQAVSAFIQYAPYIGIVE